MAQAPDRNQLRHNTHGDLFVGSATEIDAHRSPHALEELLADTRAKIGTLMLAINAKRAFWLADVNLSAAIYGGGTGAVSSAAAPSVGDASGGGH